MRRLVLVALCGLALGGCFRLSDPLYAQKGLTADDPGDDGDSLVMGSINIEGGALTASELDSLCLRRLGSKESFLCITENILFRAFQKRSFKAGHFVFTLPPGAYELHRLEGGPFGKRVVWDVSAEAAAQSRFYITRPGAYDLGLILIKKSEEDASYSFEFPGPTRDSSRREVFKGAVAGTKWERHLGHSELSAR